LAIPPNSTGGSTSQPQEDDFPSLYIGKFTSFFQFVQQSFLELDSFRGQDARFRTL